MAGETVYQSQKSMCAEHSGQIERINSIHGKLDVLFWVLGVLILVIVSVGGYLTQSVTTMNTTAAVTLQRLTVLEMGDRLSKTGNYK